MENLEIPYVNFKRNESNNWKARVKKWRANAMDLHRSLNLPHIVHFFFDRLEHYCIKVVNDLQQQIKHNDSSKLTNHA